MTQVPAEPGGTAVRKASTSAAVVPMADCTSTYPNPVQQGAADVKDATEGGVMPGPYEAQQTVKRARL